MQSDHQRVRGEAKDHDESTANEGHASAYGLDAEIEFEEEAFEHSEGVAWVSRALGREHLLGVCMLISNVRWLVRSHWNAIAV